MFNLERFIKDLETVVNIDSGSYDPEGVNKVQDIINGMFSEIPEYKLTVFDAEPHKYGKSMLFTKNKPPYDLLILCHSDTVFPKGEVAIRPFNMLGDEITGPGTADMKAGCLFTAYAMLELEKADKNIGNIAIFYNGEHEIGCPNTRNVIEDLIKQSRVVISGECTRGNGAYVKQRKGILRYTFTFEGVAAHAGNNPEDGSCAVTEMARWVLDLKNLEDFSKGISVNTGIANGGTSVNSIPDKAELRIDIRVRELADADMMISKIAQLTLHNPKVKVTVKGGVTRPPMVPNDQTEKLCTIVENIGKNYLIDVKWASVGGGSDASFAPALGKPALCGLTPTGKGAHTKNEVVMLDDIKERYYIYRDLIGAFSKLTDDDLK